jgi:hypothetical protein
VSNRLASCNQPNATAAMTDDTPLPFDLPAVDRKKLTVDFNGGTQLSPKPPATTGCSPSDRPI